MIYDKYTLPDIPTDYAALMRSVRAIAAMPGASFTYLGTTLLGRAIPMITLGNDLADKTYLYVGAHHGMEHLTSSVLLMFAHDYLNAANEKSAEYGTDIARQSEERRIVVIPMLNCDGVDIEMNGAPKDHPMRERLIKMNGGDDFTRWQANARGVDLNHNYDAGFYEYKAVERSLGIEGGAPTRYSGEYPESEPEVGALCNYIRFNEGIEGCLTLHTQGEEIYCGDAPARVKSIGNEVSRLTGYRLCDPSGAAAYGGMTDWLCASLKLPSFTLECGLGENPLPSSDVVPVYEKLRRLLFVFPSLFD